MKLKLLIFIIFILFYYNLFSQNKISFEHISIKDGLSQSSVSAIIQDAHGFMWFGTTDGLNKYDGYEIKVYRNTNDSSSIPDNTINFLFEDSERNLWIGISKTGLTLYDKFNETFVLYKNIEGDSTSLSNDNVQSMCEDKYGQLWIATNNGLNKFDLNSKKFSHYFVENGLIDSQITHLASQDDFLWIATKSGLNCLNLKTEEIGTITIADGLINKEINFLYPDNENLLWIGTKKGLQNLNLEEFQKNKKLVFTNYLHDGDNSISDNEIKCILQDQEGIIWIGTNNGGLNRYDKKIDKFTIFQNNPFDLNSLSINSIMSLYEDESGILWIGTSLGGVNKINRLAKAFVTYKKNPFDANSLSTDRVRAIYEDNQGFIWFGTVYGGITKWDQENNIFYHFKHNPDDPQSLNDDYVRTIFQDKDGDFWIGTDTAGIAKFDPKSGKCKHYKHNPDNPNSISHNKIWKIFQDSKSRIWICTFGGGLCLFDKTKGTFKSYKNNLDDIYSLSDNQVTTIFEDSSGRLWVGTWSGGLNLFEPELGKFYHYAQYTDLENFTDRVYVITEDSNGNIWTANKETFNKFDKEKNKLITYKTSNYGFKNGILMSMIEDNDNNFWITTNDGLIKLNKSNFYDIRTYFDSDGLQSNEFMVNAYLKTSKGQIIVGGINGVDAFYPEEIRDNKHIPKIALTSFKVLNKEFKLDTSIIENKEILLSYKDNEFSFEFVALDYSYSEKNKYAYMLEGFDEEMISCENRRFASYTNLDPGEYIFKVTGSNNDGIWNEEGVEIKIKISAPFWKKPWFYILIALAGIGLIFVTLKYRDLNRDKNQLEVQVQKRTEKIIQQKEEIVAQMEQIENQRNRLEQSYLNLKVLTEIGQQITSNLSVEKIIEIVHQNIINLMTADLFAIGIYNDEKERLDFINTKIKNETVPKFNISISDKNKLAIWCFTNKSEVFINDYETEHKKYIEDIETNGKERTMSIIYFPIISNNECTGVLTVQNYEKNTFTNYHLSIIKNIAVYASIAFNNSYAYDQIKHQKKGITDSIFYASRIQSAILTPKIFLDAIFREYFILNKPRDIVSGDFYWIKHLKINNEEITVFTVADCTGHGVPGAFMSMLGISILNELAAYHKNIQQISPDVLLNELRETIIKSLHQTGKIGESQDGMDIALCIINQNKMTLDYAGANNPMYLFRKNTETNEELTDEYILIEKLADRMPIGFLMGKDAGFKKQTIDIKQNDTIYIFSDGYPDQFGGNEGKKFLSKSLKKLLLKIQNNSMEEQQKLLEENLTEWMSFTNKQGKTYPQVDDILILGVKI